MKTNKVRKYIPYLILMIITFIIGFPLFNNKALNGHDGIFHLFRTYSTKVAFQDGQLIPMVNPNMMGGFGYSVNIFYGVLTTYIPLLLSMFIKPIGLTINILILICIFLSGLFMYMFIKSISKSNYVATLTAIIYMTSPYFLYDIYVRSALGELVCFTFLPLLFYGLCNIIYDDRSKWYLFTLGIAGLILSHSISAFMCAIFVFVFFILNYNKVFKKEVLKKLILSVSLAILISLPTILPLIESRVSSDYMVFDSTYMNTNGLSMERHALNLFQEILSIPNIIVWGYMIILVILCILSYKFRNRDYLDKKYWVFLLLAILSILLTLNIIPWSLMPSIFSTIQFPYRFLQIFSFLFATLISIIFKAFFAKSERNIFMLIILLCLCLSIPFIRMGFENERIDNQLVNYNKLKKRGEIVRSTGSASAEYLPRNAIYNYNYLKNHSMKPIILIGNGKVNNIVKKGTNLSFDIMANSPLTIELPYIYYPGYMVKLDDKQISTFETQNGLVGIYIEKGKYHITSKYQGTIIMIGAYLGFIIGLIILAILIVKTKYKKAI